MSIGITPNEQKGKCDVCGKKKKVRIIFDTDKKLAFSICADCAKKSKLDIAHGLKKYGKHAQNLRK